MLKKIDWVPTIFLLTTPPLALTWGILYISNFGFSWGLLTLTIFFYYACGMSITVGYHRLFSHKTYDANNFVKAFLLFFGAGSFQHSALQWGAGHRMHHRYVDTDLDPYNAKKGFWYSHFTWMLIKHPKENIERGLKMSKDLQKDSLVKFQDDHYLIIAILAGFILPLLLGFIIDRPIGALVFAGLIRMVLVHHFTYFINSLCHIFGSQNYGQENTAKDSWWLSLLTYGEGYHNFHHHFQNDYRNGIRWFDFDPSKWAIYLMSKLGMTWNLKTTSEARIIASKTKFEHKKIQQLFNQQFIPLHKKIERLKENLDLCLTNYSQLQSQYIAAKKQQLKIDRTCLKELKQEMRKARHEMLIQYQNWKQTMETIQEQFSAQLVL